MATTPDPQAQRQIQIRVDESRMTTAYTNMFRTYQTADECVLDFGMNLPQMMQDNQPVFTFNVGARVVMNWQAAKQLAITLGQAVRQYEDRNGPIKPPAGTDQPGGGSAPRLAT